MRTLFVILAILGLVLAKLGWSEYRAACDRDSKINALESESMEGDLGSVLWSDFGLPELKKDSLAVICFGVVYLSIGAAGFFMVPKKLHFNIPRSPSLLS